MIIKPTKIGEVVKDTTTKLAHKASDIAQEAISTPSSEKVISREGADALASYSGVIKYDSKWALEEANKRGKAMTFDSGNGVVKVMLPGGEVVSTSEAHIMYEEGHPAFSWLPDNRKYFQPEN